MVVKACGQTGGQTAAPDAAYGLPLLFARLPRAASGWVMLRVCFLNQPSGSVTLSLPTRRSARRVSRSIRC